MAKPLSHARNEDATETGSKIGSCLWRKKRHDRAGGAIIFRTEQSAAGIPYSTCKPTSQREVHSPSTAATICGFLRTKTAICGYLRHYFFRAKHQFDKKAIERVAMPDNTTQTTFWQLVGRPNRFTRPYVGKPHTRPATIPFRPADCLMRPPDNVRATRGNRHDGNTPQRDRLTGATSI